MTDVVSPLRSLMAPKSVAIVGASPRHKVRGNTAVLNLRDFGFTGDIYPIHPTASEVAGLRCYPSLKELPAVPECVIVALAAEKVVPALAQAASMGSRAAVVYASGFAEGGAEGQALQRQLVELSRTTGMRVCGPNSLGLCNVAGRMSMYGAVLPENLNVGGLAILSHSGSACIALSNLGRFGLSYVVSVGNGAVVDVDAYLDYLADDTETTVAALFIESIRDPDAFARAAQRMQDVKKPVIALKVGRSARGAAVTAAHTGSLAGSQAVYADYFRRCGVIAVDDLDEMAESLAIATTLRKKPRGLGVAIINVSGGESALNCDVAERAGVLLPELAPATVRRLEAIMPRFARVSNPLDATGTAVFDMQLYSDCVRTLAQDPGVAVVAVSQDSPAGMGSYQADNYRNIAEHVAAVAREVETPVIYYSNVAGGVHPAVSTPLRAAGVPVLQGTRAALIAIQRHMEHGAHAVRSRHTPFGPVASLPQDARWRQRLALASPFTEAETKAWLADYGITVTREALATNADEAVSAAVVIGFPVVLKISSPAIPHKTEAGGVVIGLRDEAAVREAFQQILLSAKAYAPQAPIEGILVQEMVEGIEVIVGLARCDPFGHSLIVGAGGILVELLADSALGLVPIDDEDARALIARTRVSRLLAGYRGSAPADVDALAALLCAISELALRFDDVIDALDLNPVAILPGGKGLRVLDGLLVHRPTSC